MKQPILQLSNVCKSFFGVQVLYDISLDLREGEILGLVGENGAGKSTMMNIIGGVLPSESGSMQLEGQPYEPSNPTDATNHGIAFIHQELSLFTNLTVAENIFIDSFPKGFAGAIKHGEIQKRTKEFLEQYRLETHPTEKVANLPMGTRQMIEIIKALVKNAKVLIFDEPTTSLSTREKETLFSTIDHLQKSGISIIYISHILEDVLRICERITVLRDGHVVGTEDKARLDKDTITRMMVGRELHQVYPDIQKEIGDVIFEIENLSCADLVKSVSLQMRSGEIVGLFGLMGAGRSELVRAAFGVDPKESGRIIVHGEAIEHPTPQLCIGKGMAFITENRREEGLMMPKMVQENLAMVKIRDIAKRFNVIDAREEKRITDQAIVDMGIRAANPAMQTANSLSGGNQQKVVVGKWIVMNPGIFIVDEPTRGIDVGAKFEIYTLLLKLAASGAAILFISSEMEELMGMCDRIAVMKNGEICGSLEKNQYDQASIMTLAL